MATVAAGTAAVALASPVRGPFGRGADQVWIVRRPGPVRTVIVFGHGWKHAPPSASYPWVGQFWPWLDHLTLHGDAVIFPRYQLGGDAPGAAVAAAFRAGVAEGLHRLALPAETPVVAIGYSYGATLALTYAANAQRWRLPPPRAVDAVFPAGAIPGISLPPLPRATDVLIQVGDRDTVAGSGGASAFWAWLARHPPNRKRYQVVRSHGSFVADHASPKSTTLAARDAFWTPLDLLVSRARR
jgi:hypothetical protein